MRRPTHHGKPGWVMTVVNGAKETRTPDPLHAMQVLYQLSYGPGGMLGENSPGDPLRKIYSRSLTECARPAQRHALRP